MNNADLIVKTLKAAGIDYGFGIPSGNVLPLMEAMRTGDMEFVLTAHEGSAGFSADVMGRLTEKPGLCIATLGPGATNLSTGVGNAWLDRSPLIAITCNLNTNQLGRRIQMYIDHEALFKPITKASFALRPGNIVETLEKAVKIALSEPRGPVHIDLPEDVALAAATETPPTSITQAAYSAPAADTSLAKAEELIAKAKHPIAVLGSSAMRMQNMDLLREFVERNGIPFATTTMAKGLIDEAHPLSIGCIERACRQVQRAFLRGADLIIGLGYDTIEVEYEAWIGDVPLLQIDIEAVDTDGSVEIACEVTGDLDSSLSKINALNPAQNDWSDEILSDHRQTFHDSLRPPSENFAPHHVIDIVRAALPLDGILTFDVGAHTHQIASQWTAHQPRSFLITNGWSSMGFGLPSAVSAKLARPDLPVVCILGDGCFQMTCGEVATALRLNLPLPIVVLDDRWLSLIQIKQTRRQFGIKGTALDIVEADVPPAHYFGVPVIGVTDASGLESALETAFAASGPTVIEARVDPAHYMDTVFD